MNNKFIIDKVEIIPLKNYDDNNYSFITLFKRHVIMENN